MAGVWAPAVSAVPPGEDEVHPGPGGPDHAHLRPPGTSGQGVKFDSQEVLGRPYRRAYEPTGH